MCSYHLLHLACSNCRKLVRAFKSFSIDRPPSVLTIQLKRFADFTGRKIDKHVAFSPSLNLAPFLSNSTVSSSGGSPSTSPSPSSPSPSHPHSPKHGSCAYHLYGVLVHAGWSTHSGHYYCFVKGPAGTWHRMDDSRVGACVSARMCAWLRDCVNAWCMSVIVSASMWACVGG